MIFHQIPPFIPKIFPKFIWEKPSFTSNIKTIYLTFDDGPTPEVTDFVLNQLNQFEAKASFFCIGKNIQENPEIFERIIQNKHSIGNHTFNHLNAFKFPKQTYEENFFKCEKEIQKFNVQSIGFRPPYGRFTPYIYQELIHHKPIIMWSVLTGDYDKALNPLKAFEKIIKNLKDGDIIVFHDSVKAYKNLSVILPKILAFGKDNSFQFKAL